MIHLLQIEESGFSICKNNATSRVGSLTASSIYPNGGIFCEDDMKTKVCFKCKKRKKIKYFQGYYSGQNKGHYHPRCKKCEKEYRDLPENKAKQAVYAKKYLEERPWMKTYYRISCRCNHDRNNKYFHKVKVKITPQQLKVLWFRDKAWLLDFPSIDRIDSKKDYTPENCRYIEFLDNCRNRVQWNKGKKAEPWMIENMRKGWRRRLKMLKVQKESEPNA